MFDAAGARRLADQAPLADLLRPSSLDEVVGQTHLVGPEGALRRLVESRHLVSMILWGPAGTGKTTLARIVATGAGYVEESLSAVAGGVKDVREALERARERRNLYDQRTALFIDEVHRFNKAQQDLLLPATESGEVVLIGATTENPYFEVNAALLSRCTLWRLTPLGDTEITTIVARGARHRGIEVDPDALEALVASVEGDARAALTTFDTAVALARAEDKERVDLAVLARARDGRLRHQSADSHYDQVSAFIKSMRGSDPDAALYWLVTLLENGESPRFLVRRMVILASEDVGLADPQALVVATAAARALETVGLPEARLNLAQCAIYLALAPKSNSVTAALARTDQAVRQGNAGVPTHLRDAHYAGAATEGFGEGYRYAHDFPGHWVEQRYLPEDVAGPLYEAVREGAEADLAERWWNRTHPHQAESGPPVE